MIFTSPFAKANGEDRRALRTRWGRLGTKRELCKSPVIADGLSFTRARAFRKALTPPEFRLWQALRRNSLGKCKFRRQHPIGPYILDFYCAASKLAIEVDGAVHNEPAQIAHDRRRTAWLHDHGVRVVRLSAVSVMRDHEAVVDFIYELVRSRLAAESPPPDR